ncbi:MAG: hypothetical protein KKH98_12890, partial [Spirochaetes bacterium]|nr:hypothetical protein [Spirochaetota bacterium]
MKRLKRSIIILCIVCTCFTSLSSAEKSENIVQNKQIIGTVKDFKPLNDGIILKDNYIEIKEFDKYEQYFIIVLGQAKYLDSIDLYWIEGFEPESYRIEVSKNLFQWDSLGDFKLKKFTKKDGLIISSHSLKDKAAFFVKVTILKPKKDIIKISEVQLFTSIALKLEITDSKARNIQKSSAELVFVTSIPASGYVRFGDGPQSLNQNVGMEMDIFKEHKIKVGSLLHGTMYYFQPVVRDLNGNLIVGKVDTFKTKGIPLPKWESVQVYDTDIFQSSLKWSLNIPCRSELYLGTSQDNLKRYFRSKQSVSQYNIMIKKLVPHTRFFYKIIAADRFQNKIEQNGDFTTKAYNIALHKKVYGSFYFPFNHRGTGFDINLLKKITDGIYDTKGIASSGDLDNNDQSVIIDLGKE